MIVQGTNLSMIRGDSETIQINLTDELNNPFLLSEGDTVYFTVKLNTKVEEKIFQKVITQFEDGMAIIRITPEDTKNLNYKTYVYDIQLTTKDGEVKTIILPSKITIGAEVTYE